MQKSVPVSSIQSRKVVIVYKPDQIGALSGQTESLGGNFPPSVHAVFADAELGGDQLGRIAIFHIRLGHL